MTRGLDLHCFGNEQMLYYRYQTLWSAMHLLYSFSIGLTFLFLLGADWMLMSVFCSVVRWVFDQVVVMLTCYCSTFFTWSFIRILQRVPLGYRSPRWCQHIHPVPQFSSIGTASKNHFTNRFWCTNSVIINNSDNQCDLLDLFEWYLKSERFIVIRIQSTFLDACFLLFQPFSWKK